MSEDGITKDTLDIMKEALSNKNIHERTANATVPLRDITNLAEENIRLRQELEFEQSIRVYFY